jgi:hypothetical protein
MRLRDREKQIELAQLLHKERGSTALKDCMSLFGHDNMDHTVQYLLPVFQHLGECMPCWTKIHRNFDAWTEKVAFSTIATDFWRYDRGETKSFSEKQLRVFEVCVQYRRSLYPGYPENLWKFHLDRMLS